MDLSVQRASDVPLGTQLAWKLRAAGPAGRLRPGDRLPAVRELAAAAGGNGNTARAVYARLAQQGGVGSEEGRGTFVADAPRGGGAEAELIERAERDARKHDVDPREVAALLYARFDRAFRPPPGRAPTRGGGGRGRGAPGAAIRDRGARAAADGARAAVPRLAGNPA